ncbi:MAG: SpoIIE family protein phosphatase [Gammaproteobacteria bacterium]
MKLRTRITLIACGCFAMLATLLVVDGRLRQQAIEKRYEEALITGHRNAWAGISDAELRRLAALLAEISRNDSALRALAARDREAYAAALQDLRQRLLTDPTAPVLETATADGALFFSTAPNPLASEALTPELIAAAITKLAPLRGLIRPRRGHLALAVVAPLFARGGVSGVAALSIDLAQPLNVFAASVDHEVFIVNQDKQLEHATTPSLWRLVAGAVAAAPDGENFTVNRMGNLVFTLVRLPVRDVLERPSMILFASRNITAEYWHETLVSGLSYGFGALVLLLSLSTLYWYMRRSFKPLNAVIGVLNALARGNTKVMMPAAPRNDEIGRLAGTLEAFRQGQEAHGQLAAFRQELDMATRIQRSILPTAFPLQSAFELSARLYTAREVGGDFYDFFTLPDGRLGLVIADVSGKGLAAALFMAVARTALRSTAMIVAEPGACLARTNDLLSVENDAAMFVTVFYGVFEPASGRLVYANGGHNPPALVNAHGQVDFLDGTEGMALGIMAEMPYAQREIVLAPGDRLVLYTDGVTDAIDEAERAFTTDGLIAALAATADADADEIIHAIVARVQAFAGATPQFDDITLMALDYQGSERVGAKAYLPAPRIAACC